MALPKHQPDLDANRWGSVIAGEETGETSRAFASAGGDQVIGVATVISAMGAGKRAARAIAAKLHAKAD